MTLFGALVGTYYVNLKAAFGHDFAFNGFVLSP
jgi:hypothetical protein